MGSEDWCFGIISVGVFCEKGLMMIGERRVPSISLSESVVTVVLVNCISTYLVLVFACIMYILYIYPWGMIFIFLYIHI